MKKSVLIFLVGLIPLIAIVFQNCSPTGQSQNTTEGGSTVGNPMTSLRLQAYATEPTGVSASAGKVVQKPDSNFDLQMCVYFLYLKWYIYTDTYDADRATGIERHGLIHVLPNGTPIGDFKLKDGVYNQVELNMSSNPSQGWTPCAFSLKVKNSQGEFISYRSLTATYRGSYIIDTANRIVEIPIQSLVDAMAEVNADANACSIDPNRPDCLACTQNPSGPSCITIERQIVEKQLGFIL